MARFARRFLQPTQRRLELRLIGDDIARWAGPGRTWARPLVEVIERVARRVQRALRGVMAVPRSRFARAYRLHRRAASPKEDACSIAVPSLFS
jgi:hypothetical protein